MPTSYALALGRLSEAGDCLDTHSSASLSKRRPPTARVYISPALYTIPDPAPIPPDSSTTSVSPSPYVFNRKRRNCRLPESHNSVHGFEIQQKSVSDGVTDCLSLVRPTRDDLSVGESETKEANDAALFDMEIFDTKEDRSTERNGTYHSFIDSRDSVSVASYSYAEDLRQAAGRHPPLPNQSEFYDADEEFYECSIVNASPLLRPSVEAELWAARVNLYDEIERCKRAEDALARMHNQWKYISMYLSQAELSCCVLGSDRTNGLLENDLTEKFCQEVVVAMFVSEAIGRGQARVEIEAAAEVVIESKNLEISRLRDKLQYYESVNHEMSQRNQEAVEAARRRQQKMRRKQRWIWSCIGLSVTLGASVLAYSYLPQMNRHLFLVSSDFSHASSGKTESA